MSELRKPPVAAATDTLRGPPRVRRRLAALDGRPLNFDRAELAGARAGDSSRVGWKVDDLREALPVEVRGPPSPGGSWELARTLIDGYEFADPSIVRAYYDPARPLLGREMLLRLRAVGLFQVFVGVRVLAVIDETVRCDGREARVWGWRYGTLEGHLERGEMSWEVWKWLDSGEVEFRVHAISRPAPIANPLIKLGFRLLGSHERVVFLRSTRERMRRFVERGLAAGGATPIEALAAGLTARALPHAESPPPAPAPERRSR